MIELQKDFVWIKRQMMPRKKSLFHVLVIDGMYFFLLLMIFFDFLVEIVLFDTHALSY